MYSNILKKEHQNRDPTHIVLWGLFSVSSCPYGQAESEDLVCYWCSDVTSRLQGAFECVALDAVRIAEFSRVLAPRFSQQYGQDDSIKSTSVSPRGGAREPSMQLLAFHLDCANRLLEQTQRYTYGCAAPALRRSSAKKFLLGGWALAEAYKFYYVFTYLFRYTWSTALNGVPPLPPIRIPTRPNEPHAATDEPRMATERAVYGDRPNLIRPRKSVMSLSFPTLPNGLDLPTRYFISLYILKTS